MNELTLDEILYTIDAINDRLIFIRENGEKNEGEKIKLESSVKKLALELLK